MCFNNFFVSRDDCKKLPRSTSGTFNELSSHSTSGTFQSDLFDNSNNSSFHQHLQNVPGTSLNASGNINIQRRVGNDLFNVTSNGLSQMLHPHVMRKQVLENNSGSLYTTSPITSIPSTNTDSTNQKRNYPDLLELPTTSAAYNNRDQQSVFNQNMNENNQYGRKQMDNLHCTLPRKSRGITNSLYNRASAKCHNSTDSEAPLLADSISRYSSSGGEDNSENYYNSNRRFSVDESSGSYPCNNSRIGGVQQRSNSFLNLSSTERQLRNQQSLPTSPQAFDNNIATPLLNINNLDTNLQSTYLSSHTSPETSTNANTYDYHAAQLERFLEEYRNLQEQLNKMKETCEGIRQNDQHLRSGATNATTSSPITGAFMDPLLYNNVAVTTPSAEDDDSVPPKSILKNKSGTPTMASSLLSPLSNNIPDAASPLTLTPGDYTGDDTSSPYWLPRNALLKRFNGNNGGNSYNFQS